MSDPTSARELMSELRSLLNAARPDSRAIIELIQRWPDPNERLVAERYAADHFRHLRSRGDVVVYSTPGGDRMRFDPETKTLSAPNGELIKKMCCPLEKHWEELDALDERDMTRHCASCGKNVLNTKDLSAAQVGAIVRYDPHVCLHIDTANGNVQLAVRPTDDVDHTDHRRPNTRDVVRLRTIRTARTLFEINLAAALGLRPIVKRVESSKGHIGSYMQAWQNRVTGEVVVQTDFRYSGVHGNYEDWEVVVPSFDYDASNHFPEPIAAYLVPDDLQPGEHVFLEDLIENFIGSRHHGSSRLAGAEAIWTGTDFDIQYDEERDVAFYIG